MFINIGNNCNINTDYILSLTPKVEASREKQYTINPTANNKEEYDIVVTAKLTIEFGTVLREDVMLTNWGKVLMETNANSLSRTYLKTVVLEGRRTFDKELCINGCIKVDYPRNKLSDIKASWGSVVQEANITFSGQGSAYTGDLYSTLMAINSFVNAGVIKFAMPKELVFYKE
jgi:hypothetical protein